MPTGLNVIGLGMTFTNGDIFFDPVLQIEDAGFEMAAGAAVYLRTFGIKEKSARVDISVPYASGRWEGKVGGELTSVRRRGFGDPRVRLSILLYGGEALSMAEFGEAEKSNTVVGAAIAVTMPFGHYLEDKLINLGANRWTVRPQLGVTHTRGKWTTELTGSLFWYSDNDEFLIDQRLENDPLYALQAHLIYTFRPGLWISASTAYGHNRNATINGVPKDATVQNRLNSLSVGFPINRKQGLKVSWFRARTQNDKGADQDGLILAWVNSF